ncbi:MAG: DinB family protein [Candidatus Limnocylindrales bacterium]
MGHGHDDERSALLERYATGADAVDAAVDGISDEGLDYRPPSGEWTAREIVHHLADSESMAFIRLRRLLAEDDPVIAGYDEPEWARRLHYDRPIEPSLAVVRAVRAASHQLMTTLTPGEWSRTGSHSEGGPYGIERWLAIYAEHSHDHADQIRRARRGED